MTVRVRRLQPACRCDHKDGAGRSVGSGGSGGSGRSGRGFHRIRVIYPTYLTDLTDLTDPTKVVRVRQLAAKVQTAHEREGFAERQRPVLEAFRQCDLRLRPQENAGPTAAAIRWREQEHLHVAHSWSAYRKETWRALMGRCDDMAAGDGIEPDLTPEPLRVRSHDQMPPVMPVLGEVLVRRWSPSGDRPAEFYVIDLTTEKPLDGPFSTAMRALRVAATLSRGAGTQNVWQQQADERGQPFGPLLALDLAALSRRPK